MSLLILRFQISGLGQKLLNNINICEKEDSVTIIVSTYDRPDCLMQAIISVIRQTHSDWLLYVIGDHCSEETEVVVNSFNHERIYYHNCPYRIGSQSGGNSIGIACAKTPYIAFLNHDDIWLPNHLEIAIQSLKHYKAQCYFGRFIISRKSISHFPIFNEAPPPKRELYLGFYYTPTYFEPVSSWVLKSDFAKKIGNWRHPNDIFRLPIQDFYLRIWQSGAKCRFGDEITGIKFDNHINQINGKNLYEYGAKELEYVNNLIQYDITKLYRFNQILNTIMYNKLKFFKENPQMYLVDNLLRCLILNKCSAYFFFYTSIDIYSIMEFLLRKTKGARMKQLLSRRTGENEVSYCSIEEAVLISKQNFNACN